MKCNLIKVCGTLSTNLAQTGSLTDTSKSNTMAWGTVLCASRSLVVLRLACVCRSTTGDFDARVHPSVGRLSDSTASLADRTTRPSSFSRASHEPTAKQPGQKKKSFITVRIVTNRNTISLTADQTTRLSSREFPNLPSRFLKIFQWTFGPPETDRPCSGWLRTRN